MAIPRTRKPEQPNVNEAPFVNYASTPQTLYGSAEVPTPSNFRIEGNSFYQQIRYNNSMANCNHQMNESRGSDYNNQLANTLHERQLYSEPFAFGTAYGYSQLPQQNNPLPAIAYGHNSIQTKISAQKFDWHQGTSQEPARKRQKTKELQSSKSTRHEFVDGNEIQTSLTPDCDNQSVSSECCSSCSSGVLCDEPDCDELKVVAVPCDELSCDESACPCPDPCLVKAPDGCIIPTSHIIRPYSKIQNWKKNKSPWTAAAPRSIQGNLHAPLDPNLQQAVDTLSMVSSSSLSKLQNTTDSKKALYEENVSQVAAGMPIQCGDIKASTIVSGIGAHFEDSSNVWSGGFLSKSENVIDPVFNCGWFGCDEPFYSEADLGSHVHQKHVDPQLLFRCPAPACNEKMNPEPLQSHIELDHGFNFDTGTTCPAPDCAPVTFYNLNDIHSHFHRAHTDPNTQPLHCGWDACGNEFEDQDQLWNHLHDHYQPDIPQIPEAEFATFTPQYPITIVEDELPKSHTCCWKESDGACGKSFGDEEKLQQHVFDKHIKDLKKTKLGYFCEWEGCARKLKKDPAKAGFDQRSKIERHTFTHTGHKPSKCDFCGAKFSADQARDQHVRSAHTNEKPFKCTYCDKRFPQHSACLMHMRTHTGEKPLSCDICGQKFGESSNLAKHRKIHGPQGSHACNFPGCEKRFVRANQLTKHLKEHEDSPTGSISEKMSSSSTDAGEGDS